jgi:ATP-dependent Lon protease
VGKTSLARSVARSTGRRFVRLSLGGVRDEAEIRGHRRTYIGALPGKIIQSLKKVGSNNPVFLLDEIDKMSTDFRGDPAAALLEVLDPEQNHNFNDHYLDLDYDLSDVMFITTANTLGGIPLPLQDRMEIIQLSGYTEFEKLNIAMKYLVPRQKQECGLEEVEFAVGENALRTVIHHYTKESGVRSLEREIASVCRKIALRVVKEGKEQRIEVKAKDVPTYLGVPKYRLGKTEEQDEIGLVHGLSVSDYGGDILDCEVTVVAGKGKLVITGLLEKGMEESGQAATSYIRSRAGALRLEAEFYQKNDVHVHFPDFVRKDGPSAGVTMATAIASALTRPRSTRRRDDRRDHPTRSGDAHRRPQREALGRASRWDQNGDRAERKSERPPRNSAARTARASHRARRSHGRRAPRSVGARKAGRVLRSSPARARVQGGRALARRPRARSDRSVADPSYWRSGSAAGRLM